MTASKTGGCPERRFLTVWDGTSWEPFCGAIGPAFNGIVTTLQTVD